jgi:hypothetical protein
MHAAVKMVGEDQIIKHVMAIIQIVLQRMQPGMQRNIINFSMIASVTQLYVRKIIN